MQKNALAPVFRVAAITLASLSTVFAGGLPGPKNGFERLPVTHLNPDGEVLIKATLFTHTNNENKDHDTCVFATVKTPDGQTIIAHAANRDCSGDDNTEYNDGSDHQFDLDIDAPGIAKSITRGFTVHMWQETHGGAGNDTWRFNARVVLYFSGGGGNFVAEKNGVELVNNQASVGFANPR